MEDGNGTPDEAPAERNVFDSLSNSEKVLGVATAWLFFINYVFGNRITGDYGASVIVWVSMLSLGILIAMYLHHFGRDAIWHPFYPWLVRSAAWGIVVLGALDLVNGIFNSFSSSGRFYEIAFYIASAAIGVGLYLMRGDGLDG